MARVANLLSVGTTSMSRSRQKPPFRNAKAGVVLASMLLVSCAYKPEAPTPPVSVHKTLSVNSVQPTPISADLALYTEDCCGLIATTEPSVVAPGEHGVLNVEVQVSRNAGAVLRKLIVRAKEIPKFEAELQTRYTNVGRWWAVPSHIDFGLVDEGSMPHKRLRLYLDPGAAQLMNVQSVDARLTVQELKGHPGDYHDFDVSFAVPPRYHGKLEALFKIHTADPVHNSLSVPVRALVKPCARAIPNVVRLGEFKTGVQWKQDILVSGRIRPVKLAIVESPSWLTAKIGRKEGKSFIVRCTALVMKPGAVSGDLKLRVTTDHTFDLLLPIVGFAQDAGQ